MSPLVSGRNTAEVGGPLSQVGQRFVQTLLPSNMSREQKLPMTTCSQVEHEQEQTLRNLVQVQVLFFKSTQLARRTRHQQATTSGLRKLKLHEISHISQRVLAKTFNKAKTHADLSVLHKGVVTYTLQFSDSLVSTLRYEYSRDLGSRIFSLEYSRFYPVVGARARGRVCKGIGLRSTGMQGITTITYKAAPRGTGLTKTSY